MMKDQSAVSLVLFLFFFSLFFGTSLCQIPIDEDPTVIGSKKTVTIPVDSEKGQGFKSVKLTLPGDIDQQLYVSVSKLQADFNITVELRNSKQAYDVCFGEGYAICPISTEILESLGHEDDGTIVIWVRVTCLPFNDIVEYCPVQLALYSQETGSMMMDYYNPDPENMTDRTFYVDVNAYETEVYDLGVLCAMPDLQRITIEAQNPSNTNFDLLVSSEAFGNWEPSYQIAGATYELGEMVTLNKDERNNWCQCCMVHVRIYAYADVLVGLRAIGYPKVAELTTNKITDGVVVGEYSHYHIQICQENGSCLIPQGEDIIFSLKSSSGDPDMYINPDELLKDPNESKFSSISFYNDNLVMRNFSRSIQNENYFVSIFGPTQAALTSTFSLQVKKFSPFQNFLDLKVVTTQIQVGKIQSYFYEPETNETSFFIFARSKNSNESFYFYLKECESSLLFSDCTISLEELQDSSFPNNTNGEVVQRNDDSQFKSFMIHGCQKHQNCFFSFSIYGVSSNDWESQTIPYALKLYQFDPPKNLSLFEKTELTLEAGEYKSYQFIPREMQSKQEILWEVTLRVYTGYGDNSVYVTARPQSGPGGGPGHEAERQNLTKVYADNHVPYPSGLRTIVINSNFDYVYTIVVFTESNSYVTISLSSYDGSIPSNSPKLLKMGFPLVGVISQLDQIDYYFANYDFSDELVWVNINELLGKFDVVINYDEDNYPTRDTYQMKIAPNDPMARLDFGKEKSNKGTLKIAVMPREGYFWETTGIGLSYELSFNVGKNRVPMREGAPFKATIQAGEILTFYCLVSPNQAARISVEDANFLGMLNSRVSIGDEPISDDKQGFSSQSSQTLDSSLLKDRCKGSSTCTVWIEVQNPKTNDISFLVDVQSGKSMTYMEEDQTYFVDYDPDNTLLDSIFVFVVRDYESHVLLQADLNTQYVNVLARLVDAEQQVVLELKAQPNNGYTAEFGLDDFAACKPYCQIQYQIVRTHWDEPPEVPSAETWVTLVVTTMKGINELFMDNTEQVIVAEGRSRFYEIDTSFLDCNLNIVLVPQLGDCSLGVNPASLGAPVLGKARYNSEHMGFDIINLNLTEARNETNFIIGAFSEHRTSVCELSAVCTGESFYNELKGGQPMRLLLQANQSSIFYYQTTQPNASVLVVTWDSYNVPITAYMNYVKGDSHITEDIPDAENHIDMSSEEFEWDWDSSGFLYLADRDEVGYHWFYILNLIPKQTTFITVLLKTNLDYLDLDDGATHLDLTYLSTKSHQYSGLCNKYKVDNYIYLLEKNNLTFNENQKIDLPYTVTFQPVGFFVYDAENIKIQIENDLESTKEFKVGYNEEEPAGLIEYLLPPTEASVWNVDFCSFDSYLYMVSGFSALSTRVLAFGEPVDSRLIPGQIMDFYLPTANRVHRYESLTIRVTYDSDFIEYGVNGTQVKNNSFSNIPIVSLFEGAFQNPYFWSSSQLEYLPLDSRLIQTKYSSFNSTIIKIFYRGYPLKILLENKSSDDSIFFDIEAFFGDSIRTLNLGVYMESIMGTNHSDLFSLYVPNTGFLNIEITTCMGVVSILLINSNTQERLYVNASTTDSGTDNIFSVFVNKGNYILTITALEGIHIKSEWGNGDVAESENALYSVYAEFATQEEQENKIEDRISTKAGTDKVLTRWMTNNIEIFWSELQIKELPDVEESYTIQYRVILTRYSQLTDIISVCPSSIKYIVSTEESMESSHWIRFVDDSAENLCQLGKCKIVIPANVEYDFTMGRIVAAIFDENGEEVARHYYDEFRVYFSWVKTGLGIAQLLIVFGFLCGSFCTCYLLYFSAKKVVKKVDQHAKEKFEMADISAIVTSKEKQEKYSSLIDEGKDAEKVGDQLENSENQEKKE